MLFWCFSLVAFHNFSLCLIFVNLITMCLCVSPWVYPAWDSLCFLDSGGYCLSQVREVFDYSLFKYFLLSFFSPLTSGHLPL